MTLPPPPDSYGSQPPNGGGTPPWGGQPPQGPGGQPQYPGAPQGQPYGQPYQGQPGGPQQWGPQQPWAGGPPSPPPNKGGKGKWILVGLALVAVIAVSVVATVLVLRADSGGNGNGPTTANGDSEFASAGDTGPANIITEDPTCEAWGRIARDYVAEAESVKWDDRDPQIPATQWTPEQRAMYETVGKALTQAVSLATNLVNQTPHRVMRQLYAQFVAYSRMFIETIPSYDANSDAFSSVSLSAMSALSNICGGIDYKSIQSLAPLISEPDAPSQLSAANGDNQQFLTAENPVCMDWISAADTYRQDTQSWEAIPAKLSATEWTPEQRSVYDATARVMTDYANRMEQLGRQSGNAILEDVAVLAAQYMRAYVIAIPKYTSADNYVSQAAIYLANTVYWACKAVS
ncbi:hypothetical protein [Mycolicibacterium sp. XJ870]